MTKLTFIYYLGLSLLFTHELDAVRHAEWQLLYVLRSMSESAAYPLFAALHVPLFFAFFWLGHHANRRVQGIFRALASGFFVIHAALHFRLSGAASYHFEGVLSETLIYGAAAAGLAYLLLAVKGLAKSAV